MYIVFYLIASRWFSSDPMPQFMAEARVVEILIAGYHAYAIPA